MIDFDGEVVVVTGGGRGQGEAEAKLFAELGARVVVADIDLAPATEVADSIGESAIAVRLDVASEQSWEKLLTLAKQHFGGVDVLVNNAGVFKAVSLLDAPIEDVERMIAVNLMGCYLGIRVLGRHMLERGGGRIVNVASVGGVAPGEDSVVYGMTKGGVLTLTRGAAVELGPTVRVNSILPGGVDTRMMPDAAKPYYDSVPLRRLGTPGELANAAAFLASRASSYITGAELLVDGGVLLGDSRRRRKYLSVGAETDRARAAN
jgi:3alpha(or 20beta)-hydroxysteroid dehydrogenase